MVRTPRRALAPAVIVSLVAALAVATASHAAETTVSYDTLRTGWDPNEPNLTGAGVGASDFGQLFSTQLDGQVYAQPIVADNTVLAATENDNVYGLDPASGAIRWSRSVGPAWPASAIGCGDLVPNIGITGTPVYDAATDTAYFTAKVNDGADASAPHWYLHGIDPATGAERSGFPTTIEGTPTNDRAHPFNAFTAMQRPGLLLLGGVVYAGFASHCDAGPYVGYVVGVDAASGTLRTMWSTEGGSSSDGAGIWQSGGGLVSDGPGRILFATGNGVSPPPGPGNAPPHSLAESVVRLAVNANGSLTPKDFFSPVNNTNLDSSDADLGSGGPMAIPDGYGTAAHPHLLVQVGKDGRVFLLDRDDLGGTAQGPGGTDAVLQTAGPYNGVWGHPAFWGGGSGYVYTVENAGNLRAFQVGVDGNGAPALTAVGATRSTWGYTSGSPVVTSDGTRAGSALVWAVYSSGSTGSGAQLRAYDAVPAASGAMTLRFSAPIGTAAKFAVPATDGGRVYVGNRDGMLFCFGRPVAAALTGPATNFGAVSVKATGHATATLTATRPVTITGVSTSAPFAARPPALPVSLTAGQHVAVPVRFTPTVPGSQSGTLDVATDSGHFAFDLHGRGTRPGVGASPASLAFGDVPVGGRVTLSVNVTNTSRVPEHVTATRAPKAPFGTAGLPAVGDVIKAGASIAVPVTFAPKSAQATSSSFMVQTNTGKVIVPLSGNGVTGFSRLKITPAALDFGSVGVGGVVTRRFDLTNTGNLVLTITKAAPPAAPFHVAAPVAEGQQLAPGDVIHVAVTYRPGAAGAATGVYQISSDDGRGAHRVTLRGTGIARVPVPAPAAGGWTLNGSATQQGGDTVLTDGGPSEAGDAVYPTAINPVGAKINFTVQIGGGTGADGMTFALLAAGSSRPTSIGNAGGALGFAGLSGVAVALDTFQNDGDPSANFVGVAGADATSPTDHVVYAATRTLAASLTSGTHTVAITVGAQGITVVIDGRARLAASVTVPPKAYLAFSAGTGEITDVHTVRDVTITRIPRG